MNKISSRDIRSFVAGAFALAGFRALLGILHYFTLPMDRMRIAATVVAIGLFAGLQLAIGIGIFLGRWSALFWAQIYLWFILLAGCTAIPVWWHFSPEKAERLALVIVPEILAAAVLLGLICWSGSEKFRYEPDA